MYAIHASRSTRPESRVSVPDVRMRKLSPPCARNENVPIRYCADGSIGAPFTVIDVIREPSGSVGSYVYDTFFDSPSWRYGRDGTLPAASRCHCCSSIVFTCAPVSVVVQRLFTNGRTELASAYVMSPGEQLGAQAAGVHDADLGAAALRVPRASRAARRRRGCRASTPTRGRHGPRSGWPGSGRRRRRPGNSRRCRRW